MRLDDLMMKAYGYPRYFIVEYHVNKIVLYPFMSRLAAKRAIKRILEEVTKGMDIWSPYKS